MTFLDWIKTSKTFKIAIIGILSLLLLIPKGMIRDLIYERQTYRDEVVNDISNTWANTQSIVGPVITVPVKYTYIKKGIVSYSFKYINILPEELKINGNIIPEIRYRAIYKVAVYNSKLNITGLFTGIDLKKFKINKDQVQWDEAVISFGIPDMRGINNKVVVKLNNTQYEMAPGLPYSDVIKSGLSTTVKLNDMNNTFSMDLDLNGSESIFFTPIGKQTIVSIASSWKDPKFEGAFLPKKRNISESGFTADWSVLNLNRNYPQQWWSDDEQKIESSEFGVSLLFPADHYQKADRSAKYAFMFIALTFLIIFFFEMLNKKNVHIVQYLLIGIALIIFYSLLLSLSEQFNFITAYCISSVAVIVLIALYAYSILRSLKNSIILSGALVLLYGFLFTVLQIEEYSLMIGSIGLFVVLAIIMFLSRKVEWNKEQPEN